MKRQPPSKVLREPRSDLRRPSKRDEKLDDAKRPLTPTNHFEEIRRNSIVRTFKK